MFEVVLSNFILHKFRATKLFPSTKIRVIQVASALIVYTSSSLYVILGLDST